jgi:AraC-like DNA-binding protein/mannose-6-phosphate isomerase-like protein (cupin superfamily)
MERVDDKTRFIAKSQWVTVGAEIRELAFTSALHRHDGYELVMMEAGSCLYQVEEKNYDLRAGDCIFVAEGEHHALQVPQRCRLTYVDFRPQRLFSHKEMLDLFLRPFLNGVSGGSHVWQSHGKLVAGTRDLARAFRRNRRDVLKLLESTLRLVRIFAALECDRPRRSRAERARVQPALDLIYGSYGAKLSVDVLAHACMLSRSTFKRAFKLALGKAPKTFLNEHRLQQSAGLLISTDRKIADIAFSVGFANVSRFNRSFRAHFGSTPSLYRKR